MPVEPIDRPVRLRPEFIEADWGDDNLGSWFERGWPKKIGEVRLCEPGAPVAVRFFFTTRTRPAQVDPGAGCKFWYVLRAEDEARVAVGFNRAVTREEVAGACRAGVLDDLLQWRAARDREAWLLPPGTVHAIGWGVALLEVGPPAAEPLPLEDGGPGIGAARLEAGPDSVRSQPLSAVHPHRHSLLADCPQFSVEYLHAPPPFEIEPRPGRYDLLVFFSGAGRVRLTHAYGHEFLEMGEVWRLPGEADRWSRRKGFELQVEGSAALMRVTAPPARRV